MIRLSPHLDHVDLKILTNIFENSLENSQSVVVKNFASSNRKEDQLNEN
jgi:hypothetical protein